MVRFGTMVCLLGACNEFGFDGIDPEGTPDRTVLVEQTFVQQPLPRVDLLFVVDDTASMTQEQAALATHFALLADGLDAAGVAWQMGAVTTSMGGEDAGVLHGQPWIVTPGTPQRDDAFAQAIQVGTEGTDEEAGFAAAAEALALAGPREPNAGFRRPDAALHVVVVSDADDQSDAWFDTDPVGAFLDVLAAEEAAAGLPVRVSAVVGPTPSGCTSITGTAQPAERYAEVVRQTGGALMSICAANFQPLLADIGAASLQYPSAFALRERPEPGSVEVVVDGAPEPDGWSVDVEARQLVFDEPPAPDTFIAVSYLVRVEG
ncbi:MAG: DUF2460 domain-containing protein [Myxococcales bacterium]|nr:DUF2460 domain-containing protein [Myxococcales bacterium]